MRSAAAIPPQVLGLARDVARLVRAETGEQTEVFLFGSWSQGTARERSDLDIAFRAPVRVPAVSLARILEQVDGLETLRSIDVVDLDSASAGLRKGVREQGIAL